MSKHIDKKYLYQLPSGAAVHPCRLIHKDGTLMKNAKRASTSMYHLYGLIDMDVQKLQTVVDRGTSYQCAYSLDLPLMIFIKFKIFIPTIACIFVINYATYISESAIEKSDFINRRD